MIFDNSVTLVCGRSAESAVLKGPLLGCHLCLAENYVKPFIL